MMIMVWLFGVVFSDSTIGRCEEDDVVRLNRTVRIDLRTLEDCTFVSVRTAWRCVLDAAPIDGEILRVTDFHFDGPAGQTPLPVANKYAVVGRAALTIRADAYRTTITIRPELNDDFRGFKEAAPEFRSVDEAMELARRIVSDQPDGVIQGKVRIEVQR